MPVAVIGVDELGVGAALGDSPLSQHDYLVDLIEHLGRASPAAASGRIAVKRDGTLRASLPACADDAGIRASGRRLSLPPDSLVAPHANAVSGLHQGHHPSRVMVEPLRGRRTSQDVFQASQIDGDWGNGSL